MALARAGLLHDSAGGLHRRLRRRLAGRLVGRSHRHVGQLLRLALPVPPRRPADRRRLGPGHHRHRRASRPRGLRARRRPRRGAGVGRHADARARVAAGLARRARHGPRAGRRRHGPSGHASAAGGPARWRRDRVQAQRRAGRAPDRDRPAGSAWHPGAARTRDGRRARRRVSRAGTLGRHATAGAARVHSRAGPGELRRRIERPLARPGRVDRNRLAPRRACDHRRGRDAVASGSAADGAPAGVSRRLPVHDRRCWTTVRTVRGPGRPLRRAVRRRRDRRDGTSLRQPSRPRGRGPDRRGLRPAGVAKHRLHALHGPPGYPRAGRRMDRDACPGGRRGRPAARAGGAQPRDPGRDLTPRRRVAHDARDGPGGARTPARAGRAPLRNACARRPRASGTGPVRRPRDRRHG